MQLKSIESLWKILEKCGGEFSICTNAHTSFVILDWFYHRRKIFELKVANKLIYTHSTPPLVWRWCLNLPQTVYGIQVDPPSVSSESILALVKHTCLEKKVSSLAPYQLDLWLLCGINITDNALITCTNKQINEQTYKQDEKEKQKMNKWKVRHYLYFLVAA